MGNTQGRKTNQQRKRKIDIQKVKATEASRKKKESSPKGQKLVVLMKATHS